MIVIGNRTPAAASPLHQYPAEYTVQPRVSAYLGTHGLINAYMYSAAKRKSSPTRH